MSGSVPMLIRFGCFAWRLPGCSRVWPGCCVVYGRVLLAREVRGSARDRDAIIQNVLAPCRVCVFLVSRSVLDQVCLRWLSVGTCLFTRRCAVMYLWPFVWEGSSCCVVSLSRDLFVARLVVETPLPCRSLSLMRCFPRGFCREVCSPIWLVLSPQSAVWHPLVLGTVCFRAWVSPLNVSVLCWNLIVGATVVRWPLAVGLSKTSRLVITAPPIALWSTGFERLWRIISPPRHVLGSNFRPTSLPTSCPKFALFTHLFFKPPLFFPLPNSWNIIPNSLVCLITQFSRYQFGKNSKKQYQFVLDLNSPGGPNYSFNFWTARP